MATRKQRYILGNALRGWFEGNFVDSNVAWQHLSKRFLLSYPSPAGRSVSMYVHEENTYGLEQFVLCRVGTTWRGALPRTVVLKYQRANTLALNP